MKKNVPIILAIAVLTVCLLWGGAAAAEEQYPLGVRKYSSCAEINTGDPAGLTPAELADWAEDYKSAVCYDVLQSALDLSAMVSLIDENGRANTTPEMRALYTRYDNALRDEVAQRVEEA